MFPSLYVPTIFMFPCIYIPQSMFPYPYVPQSLYCHDLHVPLYLCSPDCMFPHPYVSWSLCSPIPIFPGIPIFPEFFFLGGGGGLGYEPKSVGTICCQNYKISFLFQDDRHCHLRIFILFTFQQKEVCNQFQVSYISHEIVISDTSFLSSARRRWGVVYGRRLVCLSVDVSFPEQMSRNLWMDMFNFSHTHIP